MSALTWFTIVPLASLAAWGWLLLGQGFFWRTDVRMPAADEEEPRVWPSVAVVVPARDEAEVLPVTLPSLLAQEYPGRAEVLLVDDGSTDGTGELARALAERAPGALPLRVLSPGAPEPGWTGKLWAVRCGITHALAGTDAPGGFDSAPHGGTGGTAVGTVSTVGSDSDAGPGADTGTTTGTGPRSGQAPDFLLLTDADIVHTPDSLRRLVRGALAQRLDLVSQMARLRVRTGWERLIVPAFVYFFGQLYPFRWVNKPTARTAAAAGGCALLRTEAAVRAGVPDSIKDAVIDDVTLGRAVKRTGGRIWLGLADGVASVRPYVGLGPLWRMVSRSAYAQLLNSPVLLAGTVLGLALVYLVPPVCACAGSPVGGAAWLVMTLSYVPMLRYYGQPLWLAPLLPVTAALYLAMTVDSALQHHRGRGAAWKGRTYP